jgi:hypothetical protein
LILCALRLWGSHFISNLSTKNQEATVAYSMAARPIPLKTALISYTNINTNYQDTEDTFCPFAQTIPTSIAQ